MKYSIVIPTINRCDDLLRPCIDSILQYTTVNVPDNAEIIVVANGCTDNTHDYILYLQQMYHNIQLLWFDEPMGYTKAVNEGIKKAIGDYIVLLNNDTVLLPQNYNDWLNIMVKPFEEDGNVGLTGPMKVMSESCMREFLIFFCVMIKKEVFEDLGLLDETFSPGYGEDTDFCLKAENRGYKVLQVPEKSDLYYAEKRMTGNFPIYHAGNETFKNYPDADLIHRNSDILRDRYFKYPSLVKIDGEYTIGVVDLDRAMKCDGFMADDEMIWLAQQAKKSNTFIEVGSWHGKSSRAIADNLPDGSVLYCVDHWRGSSVERDNNHLSANWEDGDHAYLEFCDNLFDHIQSGKVIPVRLSSKNAAKLFLKHGIKADTIFIDAGHTYEEVKEDAINWMSVVEEGGTICGHDCFHVNNVWPDVGRAVHEVFGKQVKQAPSTSIWVVTSPKQEEYRPKVIDCFPFNDELDILEIRLNELSDVVDRFVIVEATKTHGNKSKPLNFHNNIHRFEKFLHKITYLVIEDHEFPALDSWSIERFQRNAIMRALKDCDDRDIIIISDCDEIPRQDVVRNYRGEQGLCCVSQRLYYYKLNCQSGEAWNWLRILPYGLMKTMTPCEVRYTVNYKLGEQQIGEGGWHFSYIGDADKVIAKIESSAHQEYNLPHWKEKSRIEKVIEEGRDIYDRPIPFRYVAVDEMYPKYVRDNLKTYVERGMVK